MTNIDRELEDVIKEELIGDIVFTESDNEPIPVYKKLAGLKNLGRTYFYCKDEVNQKSSWAWAQIAQKYGDEIFGKSAQAKGNGSPDNHNSLINCRVQELFVIPKDGFKESIVKESDESEEFFNAVREFKLELNKISNQLTDEEKKNLKYNDILDSLNTDFRDGSDVYSMTSPWKELNATIKNKWKSMWKKLPNLKARWSELVSAWNAFGGDAETNQKDGGLQTTSGKGADQWIPEQTWRITITTNFDENWYKQKFKSGMLNKMIALAKSEFASHAGTSGAQNANKEYKPDEMTGRDNSKLDSIRWKMTNKVAKDFIKYFLGWTRKKKEYYSDPPFKPVQELEADKAFGNSMASKALDGRGIIGRLVQKVFSGGKPSNSISVAFQMADPNDGWTKVDRQVSESAGISPVNEFTFPEDADPFEESDFIDSERIELVESACQGNEDAVDELIYDCLK